MRITQNLAAWKRLRGYKAKGKCFGEIANEVKELAEKAADEEDVRERLVVEAFLGAIPWHFACEIRVKRVDSLKEALEEADLRKTLEDKEDSKKRVQAVMEDLRPARQEVGQRTKEARKGRRGRYAGVVASLDMSLKIVSCGRSLGKEGSCQERRKQNQS